MHLFRVSLAGFSLLIIGLSVLFTQNRDIASVITSSSVAPKGKAAATTTVDCHNQTVNQFLIIGERHHGTNWIRTIVNRNTRVRCDRDPQKKWKHGLLSTRHDSIRPGPRDALIVVTRDVFTWLPKMHQQTYCRPEGFPNRNISFSEFLKQPYGCIPHHSEKEPARYEPAAENIVQVRTNKYKNWLNDNHPDYFTFDAKPPYCTRSHLTYESVVRDGQEATIGKLLRYYGAPLKVPKFLQVEGYTSWLNENRTIVYGDTMFERERNILDQYSVDDLRFVLDSLDVDYEKHVLGYNYDYVEEYIRKRNNTTLG